MIHTELEVWVKSMELVTKVYRITRNLNSSDRYDIGSQMNRSVISIPSNIAEGAARSSTKEFIRFIDYSSGSLSELETQLMILKNLELKDTDHLVNSDIRIIRTMLYALKRALMRKIEHKR